MNIIGDLVLDLSFDYVSGSFSWLVVLISAWCPLKICQPESRGGNDHVSCESPQSSNACLSTGLFLLPCVTLSLGSKKANAFLRSVSVSYLIPAFRMAQVTVYPDQCPVGHADI